MDYKLLRYISTVNHYAWLVIRDFNEILYHHEKCGGAKRSNRQIALFQDALYECKLLDLGFSKGKNTWSNNRTNGSFNNEKFDKVLASND